MDARVASVLLAAFAGFAWLVSIPPDAGFAYDDREAIVGNPVVEGELPWPAAFDRDYWHHVEDAGHYRPGATLLLRFDANRAGTGEDAPVAFRRTNAALHALIVLLLGLALARIERTHRIPFPWFGLGVLAIHPMGSDVVAWISGRTSLISGLGAALGVLLVARVGKDERERGRAALWAFAAGLIGVFVALTGKEDGVVLALALPIAALCLGGKRPALAALAGSTLAVAAIAVLRNYALGSPMPSSPSAPLAMLPAFERIAIGLTAWSGGLLNFSLPWPPPPPAMDVDAPSQIAWILPAGCLIGATAFLMAARGLRRAPEASEPEASEPKASDLDERLARGYVAGAAGIGFGILCVLPLVQIVPAGEVFASRYLYQPMILTVFVASAGAALIGRILRAPVVVDALCIALLLLWWYPAWLSAQSYASRVAYWTTLLEENKGDARAWNAVGEAWREQGDLDQAEEHFERAHELRPRYSPPLTNLGTLAMRREDWVAAKEWLQRAIAEGPNKPVPHANLGNVLLRLNEPDAAIAAYRRAVSLAPGRAAYHRGLARALARSGDDAAALKSVEEALRLNPADARAQRLREDLEKAGIHGAKGAGGPP